MKKWLPFIFSVAGSAATMFSPTVQGWAGSHQQAAVAIATAAAAGNALLPSPVHDRVNACLAALFGASPAPAQSSQQQQ